MNTKISFIIVNFNTKVVTSDCISSLKSNKDLKKINHEIIIVDNNSTDGSVEYLRSHLDENIRIIKSSINNGFGKANNLGAVEAKGEYILLLNSDTLAQQTNFIMLIDIMDNNKDIGILSTKVLNKDNSIQSLGFKFPSLLNDLKLNMLFWNFNQIKKIRLKNYEDKGLFKTDWVSGCFMLMKKEDFILVDGFDENIFMYAEDLDLSYRLFEKGKKSYIYDKTDIYHLHGGSSNKKNIQFSDLLKRRKNYYYVVDKNALIPSYKLKIVKISYIFNAFLTSIIKNSKIIKYLHAVKKLYKVTWK